MSDDIARKEAYALMDRAVYRLAALIELLEGGADSGGTIISQDGTIGLSRIMLDIESDLEAASEILRSKDGSSPIPIRRNQKE